MEKLNSDMVQEIRSRLPIKSILCCRKVCKLWRNLLGKPKIPMLFSNRVISIDSFERIDFYYREQTSDQMDSFDYIKEPQKIYKDTGFWSFRESFVGICNGLICYKEDEYYTDVMYIHNPITGERIRVPATAAHFGKFQCAGFGYCPSTDEHKIVKICSGKNSKQRVQVYTLGDGNGWRDKPEINYTLRKSGVYANGALHWLICKDSNCYIVAFDLANEIFQSIPSPPCHIPCISYVHVKLGSVEGKLYLCFPYESRGGRQMDIWVFMKKNMNNCQRNIEENTYFNSFTWIRVFRGKRNPELNSNCEPLSVTESEILLWKDGALSCYDTKPTKSKKLWCAQVIAPEDVKETPRMNLVRLKDLGEELVNS